LKQLAAQTLGVAESTIASLQVFKRSFDARRADLLAVYIVDAWKLIRHLKRLCWPSLPAAPT
jgi:uncharacterized FAD-dependent dehydrogenase